MSGSSGSYMPIKRQTFNCISGSIFTEIASANFEVLKLYSVGHIFNVGLLNGKVVIENNDGEVLGSIIHENLQELIDCILEGNEYSAKITSISNYNYKVKISYKN
ncbi:hypothetical protein EO244_12755 [Ancylomarina salipaludis]|uniref:Uncharacterized protein n=1 Tax=Ancylomarina salipaludis TaxID=2501299 RepID=A0A4Q1JJG3_9BACT|nr:hypothetical protein [Ancylomarina salipaludis]RXQ90968.1 hypothetical protein EO244_12755 [Ancylomarina salipaludis]